jgi:hypothetical protein
MLTDKKALLDSTSKDLARADAGEEEETALADGDVPSTVIAVRRCPSEPRSRGCRNPSVPSLGDAAMVERSRKCRASPDGRRRPFSPLKRVPK